MAQSKKTLYQILGVARDASQIDIGLAHEMRAAELERRVPPDPSSQALVQQAYEILSNPKRRAAYDSQLVTAAEKSAAAEQGTPDFEIGEDEPEKSKLPMIPIAIAVVVAVVVLFFVMRPADAPRPAPVATAPVAAAPEPPPPPRQRTGAEIIAEVAAAGGPVMSYSMSGSAEPIGMAMGIEAGAMVTTCHGIPAGGKLVVRLGAEQHPADLTITDETLDLCRLAVTGFVKAPLRLADEEPKAGARIFTVAANPKGELTVAEGTVKASRKTPSGNVLEISTPVAATASGAGVFDQYGRLVGIATAPHMFGAGNVAIPVTWFTQMRSRSTAAK